MTEYNKLVRDDIPILIADSGKRVTFEVIKGDNRFIDCLTRKLTEECYELSSAMVKNDKDMVLEEAADVCTVVLAICEYFGLSAVQLDGKYHEKVCDAGEFNKRIYLVKVEDMEEK